MTCVRRSATSDWMAMEQQRGISITSTVLQFPYAGHAVNLLDTKPEPSTDPLYVRGGKPEGLLRWDLDVPAGTIGDKALAIVYSFKLEYARELAIDYFKTGGLKESPIGGMGGMGGGMGGGGMRSIPPGK